MAQDKSAELKEDRSLFAQMMIMVSEAGPETDIKETVGEYDLSL